MTAPGPLANLPRKTLVRWGVIAGVAVVMLAILMIFLRAPAVQVEAVQATRGPIDETVSDQGQARARQAYMVAAPVTGRVERLPVEIGDPVVAGQTVVARMLPSPNALLDPRARVQAEAAVASARAALASATAQRAAAADEAARARAENERTAPLGPSGIVSRQQADNVRAAAEKADRALQQADAAIRQRTDDLASAEAALAGPGSPAGAEVAITSPASGYVTHLPQQSERIVPAGTPLVEVSDRKGLEAAIEFLSQDAVKVQAGQAAEIYDWGGPKPIEASVRRIEPQGYTKVSALGVEEQRALVILQFDGAPADWAGLEPGYRVWGRIFLQRVRDAVLVPTGALVRNGSGWAVFRIESGRARLRPVIVGVITDQSAQIVRGLASGDALINFPSDSIKDGVRVKAK
jgi:HlyD family secretion protein